MFIAVEDITWVEGEPTVEQIEAAMKAQHTIDLCLLSDAGIIRAAEMDVKRVLRPFRPHG